ncbi:MAG: zinc ribbon domain-containing protein, partial [Oscillochloris sp.]|nr:zinc ribbon domain-containing protein [Oscillochloris sp.]
MAQFCSSCGARLDAPQRFCTRCGAPLLPTRPAIRAGRWLWLIFGLVAGLALVLLLVPVTLQLPVLRDTPVGLFAPPPLAPTAINTP